MSTDVVAKDLIFGCGRIKGGSEEKHYRALLDKAFELGIRRFDVAPSYGLGMAEDVLGAAIAASGLAGSVSVITKYGIPRPASPGLMSRARSIAKPIASAIPGAKQFFLKQLSKSNLRATISLSGEDCLRSVEDSLRRLRVSKLDSVLLHEIGYELVNQDLISALENMLFAKVIDSFGVSTGDSWRSLPDIGTVRQCSIIGVLGRPLGNHESLNIHGGIKYGFDCVKKNIFDTHEFDALFQDSDASYIGGVCLLLAKNISGANGVVFSTNSISRLEEVVYSYLKLSATVSSEKISAMSRLVAGIYVG
jgi:hypothetical protein